jgi:hypothetical protein
MIDCTILRPNGCTTQIGGVLCLDVVAAACDELDTATASIRWSNEFEESLPWVPESYDDIIDLGSGGGGGGYAPMVVLRRLLMTLLLLLLLMLLLLVLPPLPCIMPGVTLEL